MCGIAEASLAASIVGGITQAYGQVQQGRAAQAEANYRAAIERNNAIRAEYLAEDAIERGKEEEREERIRGRLLIGQMRAVLGGSGQVVDEGSAGELVIDQAAANELDARTIRNNSEREAQEFRIRATNSESQANLFELSGSNARRAATGQAVGTVLGTAGTVANKWYQFRKDGAFATAA